MESHILNTYHQAGYRPIGLHHSSESQSSEASFQSPEYGASNRYKDTNEDVWRDSSQDWGRANDIHTIPDANSSSDEEPAEENVEKIIDEEALDEPLELEVSANETVGHDAVTSTTGNTDDYNFNYDVIHVYAVDPNIDCSSSDDEDDFSIKTINTRSNKVIKEKTPMNIDQIFTKADTKNRLIVNSVKSRDEVLKIKIDNLTELPLQIFSDSPITNVDDFSVKDDDNILAVKDEPVVQDVDEYFIKQEKSTEISEKLSNDNEMGHEVTSVNVDEFFVVNNNKKQSETIDSSTATDPVGNPVDYGISSIDNFKEFFKEELSYTRPNAQRSCSLPQSPMHISLDLDTKTCMSFEDLDIDLTDLTFDNDKNKSSSGIRIDDIRTLTDEDVNSFLINTNKTVESQNNDDDLSQQDMEIEQPVQNTVNIVNPIVLPKTLLKTLQKPKANVFDFCIEKSPTKVKKAPFVNKVDPDDFVDVETCNEVVIPVLQASNVGALLEQFEATEKLNTKTKRPVIKVDEQKVKNISLVNGTRLQDAGVQLNRNKMRQILMPSTVNTTVTRPLSPLHSDHDYCSSKKRHSLPNIRKGQSLLKPEVLSSNSRILNSRHRACKNKKVVYHELSEDESDKCNKTTQIENSEKNKKPSVKTIKVIPNPICKKLSPVHGEPTEFKDKSNHTVMVKDACKASDTPLSQNSNGSIKLTIKNKSEVILNCDVKDSQKDKTIEKAKSVVVNKTVDKSEIRENIKCSKSIKVEKGVDKDTSKASVDKCNNISIKEEPRHQVENFYMALFSNKKDVKIPQVLNIKKEKLSFEEELNLVAIKTETEQPQKKKKLNLQEYKLRRGISSSNSSAQVSPEPIFPEMPNLNLDKNKPVPIKTPPDGTTIAVATDQANDDPPKKIFDPIKEASRKILMNSKRQKALRKRDEDIVMSKIPKVENLELQPLISEAEMMKMVGMVPAEILPIPVIEKPPMSTEYQEIVMVSVGVNTDDAILKELATLEKSYKAQSPVESKSHINFKIKKPELLKQNIFDTKKDRKSPIEEKKHPEMKIDKERLKDITATLKSVEKQVDTKISSNSLLASIQDVVLKKAPEKIEEKPSPTKSKRMKSNSISPSKLQSFKRVHTAIVRDYDTKAEHGEDKVILHLDKDMPKPETSAIAIQTEAHPDFVELKIRPILAVKILEPKAKNPLRKRTESDMSLSNDESTDRSKEVTKKPKKDTKRSRSKEKHSDPKERSGRYRQSRTPVSRKRRRSLSRSKSRSWDRYRRSRRSDSPYRRKRRSRSAYRRNRRSSTPQRDYRSRKESRSKSPVLKKCTSPIHDMKSYISLTPSSRRSPRSKSESSDSFTSSSSSSSSEDSRRSRRSHTPPYRRDDFRKKVYRSSEDREANTPVEERRIVFVGKLEKDITKNGLRSQFIKFGPILEIRLHSKEDGSRYGFVTFSRARDAWTAVGAAAQFPRYDVAFGGRRAFCRQTYADLDGLEAKYTESAFHGIAKPVLRRDADMSFEDMLLEMKKKLSQRKSGQDDGKKMQECRNKSEDRRNVKVNERNTSEDRRKAKDDRSMSEDRKNAKEDDRKNSPQNKIRAHDENSKKIREEDGKRSREGHGKNRQDDKKRDNSSESKIRANDENSKKTRDEKGKRSREGHGKNRQDDKKRDKESNEKNKQADIKKNKQDDYKNKPEDRIKNREDNYKKSKEEDEKRNKQEDNKRKKEQRP